MRVGSLCSGYGGLDLAVEAAFPSAHTVWHAESDPDAALVLKANFDGLANHGDIRTVDWRYVEPVDILAAGFPCQPVSAAGQRKAQADRRWLWPDVLRATHALEPPYLVLENVENLASIQQGAVLAGILTDLMAAGYRPRWCLLGACAVGACHHRHRFFLLAERGDGVPERAAMAKCGAPRGKATMLPTPAARDGDHRGEGSAEFWRRRRDELGRVNGMPLGAALRMLPTPRASDGRKGGPNQHGRTGDLMLPSAVMKMLPTPTVADSRNSRSATAGRTGNKPPDSHFYWTLSDVGFADRFAEYAPAVAMWADIHGEPPAPTEPNRNGAQRLSPAFAEWMMGLPTGWVTGHVGRVPALRIIGNGVVPAQAAAALRSLLA